MFFRKVRKNDLLLAHNFNCGNIVSSELKLWEFHSDILKT